MALIFLLALFSVTAVGLQIENDGRNHCASLFRNVTTMPEGPFQKSVLTDKSYSLAVLDIDTVQALKRKIAVPEGTTLVTGLRHQNTRHIAILPSKVADSADLWVVTTKNNQKHFMVKLKLKFPVVIYPIKADGGDIDTSATLLSEIVFDFGIHKMEGDFGPFDREKAKQGQYALRLGVFSASAARDFGEQTLHGKIEEFQLQLLANQLEGILPKLLEQANQVQSGRMYEIDLRNCMTGLEIVLSLGNLHACRNPESFLLSLRSIGLIK